MTYCEHDSVALASIGHCGITFFRTHGIETLYRILHSAHGMVTIYRKWVQFLHSALSQGLETLYRKWVHSALSHGVETLYREWEHSSVIVRHAQQQVRTRGLT